MKRQYSNKRSWPHKGWLAAIFAAAVLLFAACTKAPKGEATLPESEPARIGDYFYSDGSYSTELNPNKTVIGIVFQTDPARIGQAEKEALKAKGVTAPRGLVMAVKNAAASVKWGPRDTNEGLTDCETKEQNNNDISGYGNCEHIRKAYSNFDNYLAFKAADEYNNACPAPATTTGWYLPSTGQLYDLLRNLGGLEDWDAAEDNGHDYMWTGQVDVPAALNAWMAKLAPGAKDNFPDEVWLWSSSEYSGEHARDWNVGSDGEVNCYWNPKSGESQVRPVLAF